ncbi:MAG: hypothetical protein WCE52_23245 [Candidatus Acidiferrum sp.]
MTNETALEIFDHLFSLLEAQETQSAAILQFIKDKGIASDKELAPYLDQAGNASSVRWRAARVRANYLLSSTKPAEKAEEKNESAHKDTAPEANKDSDKEKERRQDAKEGRDEPKPEAVGKIEDAAQSDQAGQQDKDTPRTDQGSLEVKPEPEKHAKANAARKK